MRFKNVKEIDDFISIVNTCEDNVWLESSFGDRINLKSKLSQYIAIAALISENHEDLELYCDSKTDERKFIKYFSENPEVLH